MSVTHTRRCHSALTRKAVEHVEKTCEGTLTDRHKVMLRPKFLVLNLSSLPTPSDDDDALRKISGPSSDSLATPQDTAGS
ncbi:hypothetical protein BaRGS_00015043 [Batillaria attramentaria]|uniref:Uncharacterized protein n=1 Tax=Batillaria attramentaria TaxID=370345 RepID=A0ABD0L2U1_9CAEN